MAVNQICEGMQKHVEEITNFYLSYQDRNGERHPKVFDLWPLDSTKGSSTTAEYDDTIKKFIVEPSDVVIDFNSPEDILSYRRLVENGSENLLDLIGVILDENEDRIGKDVSDAIDIISDHISYFNRTFSARARKFQAGINATDDSFSVHKEEWQELLQKVFGSFFSETMSAIYRGMKLSPNTHIYDLVLVDINTFLKNIGIHTIPVQIGAKADLDTCDYANDEVVRFTDNVEEDDCVYEIIQFPYALGSDLILSRGQISTWRFKR